MPEEIQYKFYAGSYEDPKDVKGYSRIAARSSAHVRAACVARLILDSEYLKEICFDSHGENEVHTNDVNILKGFTRVPSSLELKCQDCNLLLSTEVEEETSKHTNQGYALLKVLTGRVPPDLDKALINYAQRSQNNPGSWNLDVC